MQKDFSYPVKIEDLTQNEQHYFLKAGPKDLEVLKAILKVESVKLFEADITLKKTHKKHRIDIKGEVKALLELKSVISLENFDQKYVAPFEYYYDTTLTYEDLRQLDASINDEVPEIIENGQIDLGQIAIEQLALVMDDYPRQSGEEFEFQSEFDEKTTRENHPFAILEKLKK